MNFKPTNYLTIYLIIGVFMTSNIATAEHAVTTSNNVDGKYLNQHINYNTSMGNIWDITKAYASTKRTSAQPSHIPLQTITPSMLVGTDDLVFRLSHSTQLLRLDGQYILTDPVFSERASMVQWAGPKRFHAMPISIESLPEINVVILSHDHYDHLDRTTIEQLAKKTKFFVVPLGLTKHLEDIVDAKKIIERDWWQAVTIEGIEYIATPAQHFSGRGLFDRDETLWASWVINSTKRKIFFSGDSGYFPGFKKIGDTYGPFDLTMMETGAYNDLWSDIHMTPEESVQAHLDLSGKYMLPIHNSTFDLSLHDWFEPLERASVFSSQQAVEMLSPIFGQKIRLDDLTNDNVGRYQQTWWRNTP